MKRLIPPLVAIVAALSGAYWFQLESKDIAPPARDFESNDTETEGQSIGATRPTTAAAVEVLGPGPGREDRIAQYGELKSRLELARNARLASPEPQEAEPWPRDGLSVPTAARLPTGSLDKDYIRDQVKEIVPLIRECYEMALESTPDLQGRVVVELKLIGEEDVGGLIESSLVVEEESDVVEPMFLECVRETMYAVELEPPEGGGSVVIKYPLNFSAGPPQGSEDEAS